MGVSEFSDIDPVVAGNLSSEVGKESRILYLPLSVEEPLVARRFHLLHFSHNLVKLRSLQGDTDRNWTLRGTGNTKDLDTPRGWIH